MDQQMSTLLHLIRSIEPVIAEEYGLMIPYGRFIKLPNDVPFLPIQI